MAAINTHYISRNETIRGKWIGFVRIHRKDFVPVKKPPFCCAYFNDIVVLIWWARKLRTSWAISFGGSLVECNVYKTS